MRCTILGANGFIGSNLFAALQRTGADIWCPKRGDTALFNTPLGTVFYCIGLTSDFRSRTFETIEAHISYLANLLHRSELDKVVYLSSTRVYSDAHCTRESADIAVNPVRSDSIYNLSKLMGESVCLNSARPSLIVRLSNVIGIDSNPNSFIGSLARALHASDPIRLESSADSEKDYISISDVTKAILELSLTEECGIYNVASGVNVTHQQIFDLLSTFNPDVQYSPNVSKSVFSPICIDKISRAINFRPKDPLNIIAQIFEQAYRASKSTF